MQNSSAPQRGFSDEEFATRTRHAQVGMVVCFCTS